MSDLFMALLSEKERVIIPRAFAAEYAKALQFAIWPYEELPDYRYASGLIDDQVLRQEIEGVFEYLPKIQEYPWTLFDPAGNALGFRLCEYAHKMDVKFGRYKAYPEIKERFRLAFAQLMDCGELPSLDALVEARKAL